MSFEIAFFSNNVLGILKNLLVLLVVAFLEIMPSICHCSETQEFVSSMASLAHVFFLRRQSTDLILADLGDQHKSLGLGLGLCVHAPGRPKLFPYTVASGLPRTDPRYGCAGSSVSIELYVRV